MEANKIIYCPTLRRIPERNQLAATYSFISASKMFFMEANEKFKLGKN